MMYISRVILTDIRCFDQFEINFDPPGQSVLIMGDNGDGKSTVLRSLAIGLCDESSAAALFRELPGEFVRRQGNQKEVSTGAFGTIEVHLVDDDGLEYRIATKITSLKTFERVTQPNKPASLSRVVDGKKETLNQDSFPWDDIFVTAYGAGVRTKGTWDSQHYLAVDAVYPLFVYDSPLHNSELAVRRLVDSARETGRTAKQKDERGADALLTVQELLADLLNLPNHDHILLTETGIKVKGRWGVAELGELGDGYRATITWVVDVLAWWLLQQDYKVFRKGKWRAKDIRGIVLIDEIEQHLHPRWQLSIFNSLRSTFPNVQFIATTHSPLVASGCEDIPIHQLVGGDHKIEKPFGWLAEDVYRFMGVESSRAEGLQVIISEFEALDRKKLKGQMTSKERSRLVQLREQLRSLPETDPTALSTELFNLAEALKAQNERES